MVIKEVIEEIAPEDEKNNWLASWKWIKRVGLGIFSFAVLNSSLYTVPNDSVGVIQTFGKHTRTTGPGIHLKFPGIDQVTRVPIKRVQTQEFGFRSLKPGVNSQYLGREEIDAGKVSHSDLVHLIKQSGERDISVEDSQLKQRAKAILQGEYLMLTGDLGMVDVEFIVQYDIKDAGKYLFNLREPIATIRDGANAVVRQLVGNGSVDEAINFNRTEYEFSAKDRLQSFLDNCNSGINVVAVRLQSTNPPLAVRPSFHEVNSAIQTRETTINEARRDYNEAVPRAKGEAQKIIEDAKGYRTERVNRARGDTSKFEQLLAEYEKAPEVTGVRLYLESMERVLPSLSEKIIIDPSLDGVLKLLNLRQDNLGKN